MGLQEWDKGSSQGMGLLCVRTGRDLGGKASVICPPLAPRQTQSVSMITVLYSITYLDGCQVLEVAVRMWDQAWGSVPLGCRVNPDLTLLVCGQELGSIRTEISWQVTSP